MKRSIRAIAIALSMVLLAACAQAPKQSISCGSTSAEQWLAMTTADLMSNPEFQKFSAGVEAGMIGPGPASMGFVTAVANLTGAETALADGESGRACLLLQQVRADPRLPVRFRPIQ